MPQSGGPHTPTLPVASKKCSPPRHRSIPTRMGDDIALDLDGLHKIVMPKWRPMVPCCPLRSTPTIWSAPARKTQPLKHNSGQIPPRPKTNAAAADFGPWPYLSRPRFRSVTRADNTNLCRTARLCGPFARAILGTTVWVGEMWNSTM